MAVNSFQSERLRLARLVNGLSQSDLAEKLDVSRQYIHSLEIGKVPSDEFVSALASLLSVQTEFFYSPVTNEVREEQCHFRQRKTTPQITTQQVIAHGTIFELLVAYLDKALSLPPMNFIHLEAHDDEEIEDAAEKCRLHWGLGLGPISNMCRVLENAGAVITYFDGLSDKVDALSISRPRNIVIRNTYKESIPRFRFDLAHECGHLVLHQGMETGDKQTERQADRFASAFLMPRKTFSAEFPRMPSRLDWRAIFELKLRWKTSAAAILYRAKDLKLIDEFQYFSGNRYLSKTGQRKAENYDDQISEEHPELVQNAVKTYLSAFGQTPADLASEIYITPILLSKISGISFDEVQMQSSNRNGNIIPFSSYQRRS
jgi:Zn-dependent peptidase ImmA (M78 family)/DNA-binding XRE family transcriptional regulator